MTPEQMIKRDILIDCFNNDPEAFNIPIDLGTVDELNVDSLYLDHLVETEEHYDYEEDFTINAHESGLPSSNGHNTSMASKLGDGTWIGWEAKRDSYGDYCDNAEWKSGAYFLDVREERSTEMVQVFTKQEEGVVDEV